MMFSSKPVLDTAAKMEDFRRKLDALIADGDYWKLPKRAVCDLLESRATALRVAFVQSAPVDAKVF